MKEVKQDRYPAVFAGIAAHLDPCVQRVQKHGAEGLRECCAHGSARIASDESAPRIRPIEEVDRLHNRSRKSRCRNGADSAEAEPFKSTRTAFRGIADD